MYERQAENRWSINAKSSDDFHRLIVEAAAASPLGWRGVVHLWSLDAAGPESGDDAAIQASVLRSCGSALNLLQALLAATGTHTPRLWLVTSGAQPVSTNPAPVAIGQAPLWGLAKVIALEHPELRCACVDLDPDNPAESPAILSRELLAEEREDQLSWRSGVRYVARLTSATRSARRDDNIISISTGKTYLITGGLGALGLEVARWLVGQGARYLVLIGRKSPSARALRSIEELERAGVRVTVIRVDVTEKTDLAQAFETVQSTHPPLGGIVHGAGVLDDGILLQQTWTRFAAVLAPKVAGAWNLHNLTQNLPLDFLVFFSSMASLLGTPGQGNYAAANAFLDGLAHHRRTRGLPALSVNWGPWASAGMAASQDDRRQQRRAAQGIETITPEEGTQVLGSLLGHASAQIGVLPVDWLQFLEQFDGGEPPPVLAGIARQIGPRFKIRPERVNMRQQLEQVPATKRHEFLSRHVREQVVQVLGFEPAFPVDPNKPFKELGMDSLMTIELAKMLSIDVGRPVPAAMVFTYPTASAIAAYLLDELFPQVSAEAAQHYSTAVAPGTDPPPICRSSDPLSP
jgi:Dehydrogenases with different specificities (related to short-chain alcohol dehydrogenases)